MKYAKKEVKEQIIRCDQLIEHIKKIASAKKSDLYKEKDMYELADFFLRFHTPNTVDYTKKYFIEESEKKESESKQNVNATKQAAHNNEDTPLYKDLKQYRLETSKAEGVKPYFIYNNAQMEELISVMPKTLSDIKKISGFGDVKIEKYGNAILEIVKKYS